MVENIKASLQESHEALKNLMDDRQTLEKIARAGDELVNCFKSGGRVYSCGNGGSLCDATHFAEELSGKFRKNRPPLPALAINDSAHITCTANDFGYEEIYSRFIKAHGRKGDILLGISTSGKSNNVLEAAKTARSLGIKVVTLTGRNESPLKEFSDIDICTPGGDFSDRVQELHIKVIHILIEFVERKLFPANY